MPLPPEVRKYLDKNLIHGWKIIWDPTDIENVVVIPAVKEYNNIQNLISSLSLLEDTYISSTLFLFVINNLETADNEVRCNNKDTIRFLNELIINGTSGLNLGYIDASSPGKELSIKEGGVGLARKIGMDLALEIFNFTSSANKLLICLDADCTVSTNYLTGIRNNFNNSSEAASIYFEHPSPLSEAIICYEIFLRYYVASLRSAQSNYGFHTIGSSMACTSSAYIKTGGMNKRKAAEDFYFLEKLAKYTRVKPITDVTVYPSSRESWRVPFGTGQRVTRFYAGTHDEYLLYNPDSFKVLNEWLILLKELPQSQPSDILKKSEGISIYLRDFLLLSNFEKDWDNIFRTSRSDKQIFSQIDLWFDGFKTLKLIHYLRDTIFPNSFMFGALDLFFEKLGISFEYKSFNLMPDTKQRLQYLETLRAFDKQHHN